MVKGKATVSREITYDRSDEHIPRRLRELKESFRPVVVWNLTAKCNLKCVHCYAHANQREELDTETAVRVVKELNELAVLVLFSGGEPLLRKDLFEIARYCKVIKALSTNGTLIDNNTAEMLKNAGFSYVGISLDGLKDVHDRFRGVDGAFERAVEGLKSVKSAGILSGVRFTLTKFNSEEVEGVLDLCEDLGVERFCMYHLVPSGRADFSIDVPNDVRRNVIDYLFERAFEFDGEILTVDNPCDGVYFCLKLREIDEDLAFKAYEFLKYRGGDRSGRNLVNIDPFGEVHPNQFWWDYSCGNVKERNFKDIWFNDPLLNELRGKWILKGRCGRCAYKSVCGGFRLRAMRAGDLWGEDPSCYLKDDEIAKNVFE
ncbi:Radical SAM domain protein [Archaeoglobus profundus DSM 5631]|uniref:Radical SAM domain protein n=2 Tax=Archaeoglobus profundus TaxID=84156 RepID=D2RGH1_ARCPA|nr:Radical SAM domain protein [Archaeoglobus profundus DSM 5631]